MILSVAERPAIRDGSGLSWEVFARGSLLSRLNAERTGRAGLALDELHSIGRGPPEWPLAADATGRAQQELALRAAAATTVKGPIPLWPPIPASEAHLS